MECFKCSSCDCKLLPGDQYGISNGRLLCRSDLDVLCEGVQSPTGQPKGGAGDLYLCLKCVHVFVCTCVSVFAGIQYVYACVCKGEVVLCVRWC